MAGVSYCVERKEKQPAAGPGRCSIKWFINARQKEAQPGSAGRERERERGTASEHHSVHTIVAVQQSTHINTPPSSLSFSRSLSLSLSHTHARTLSHTDTHAGVQRQCSVQWCRAVHLLHDVFWSSLIRTVSVLFSAVTDNSVNKRCQRRAVSYCPLT